jgi:hypothetical protein
LGRDTQLRRRQAKGEGCGWLPLFSACYLQCGL